MFELSTKNIKTAPADLVLDVFTKNFEHIQSVIQEIYVLLLLIFPSWERLKTK